MWLVLSQRQFTHCFCSFPIFLDIPVWFSTCHTAVLGCHDIDFRSLNLLMQDTAYPSCILWNIQRSCRENCQASHAGCFWKLVCASFVVQILYTRLNLDPCLLLFVWTRRNLLPYSLLISSTRSLPLSQELCCKQSNRIRQCFHSTKCEFEAKLQKWTNVSKLIFC